MEYDSRLLLNLGNPFINQSTIRYHSSTGIKMDSHDLQSQSGVSIKITNNVISSNTGGLSFYGYGEVIVSGNTISDNIGDGGIDGTSYSVTISGNTIENNKVGRYESYDGSFRVDG